MLNPEYQSITLQFTGAEEGKPTAETAMYLIDDQAGDAFEVLRALKAFVIAAGFTWVANVAFEKADGTMIFSDEDGI